MFQFNYGIYENQQINKISERKNLIIYKKLKILNFFLNGDWE